MKRQDQRLEEVAAAVVVVEEEENRQKLASNSVALEAVVEVEEVEVVAVHAELVFDLNLHVSVAIVVEEEEVVVVDYQAHENLILVEY
jgi:hypothetical protein